MPDHKGTFKLCKQESQIFLQNVKAKLLVGHNRINTERAGIWTTHAGKHGDNLYKRRLFQSALNKFPPFFYPRKLEGLLRCRQIDSLWTVRNAIVQDFAYSLPMGHAQHI